MQYYVEQEWGIWTVFSCFFLFNTYVLSILHLLRCWLCTSCLLSYYIQIFPCTTTYHKYSVFIKNTCWILLKHFLSLMKWSCDSVFCLFMVWIMFMSVYVKPFHYSCNETNWSWWIIILHVFKFNLQIFYC